MLQKIFQAITLLGDSIDETKNALEMTQGSLFIEGKQRLAKTDVLLSLFGLPLFVIGLVESFSQTW